MNDFFSDKDDWWEPQSVWTTTGLEKERRENPYTIERAKRVPVTGNVSHIVQWNIWSRHATWP